MSEGLITIDQFAEVQLRTARVTAAEPHPDADRLLRLEIDLGGEQRQLVAGIADSYAPSQLVGKTIVVVANLKPAKLRGLRSDGMLLAASDEEGQTRLLTVEGDLPPGAKIR